MKTLQPTTKQCELCGAEFEALVATVAGKTVSPFRFCSKCTRANRRTEATESRSRRLLRWAAECPAKFQKSDTARFPAVWEVIKGWTPDSGEGIGLIDRPGTCKTRMIWWLARNLAERGEIVRGITHAKLQTMAQHQWTLDNLDQIERLTRCRTLFIDDLGKAKMAGEALAKLWDIIDKRASENRPILWTSNYTGRDLAARIGDGMAGPMLGRLADQGAILDTEGQNLKKTTRA